MNALAASQDWIDANQRLMVAEFDRLKQRLGVNSDGDPPAPAGELRRTPWQRLIAALFDEPKQPPSAEAGSEPRASAVESARAAMPAPAAIDYLVEHFGLSAFERNVLLLCAGVEMDSQLAAQCEIASGPPRRPGASFGLALAALDEPDWGALAPVSPLRRWRFVEVDESAGLAQGRLRIDERILHYLAGVNYLDLRLRGLLRAATPPVAMADTHRAVCAAVQGALETASAGDVPVIWLTGDDAPGQADVAAEVSAALGVRLHVLRAEDVPASHAEVEALATLWEREAILLGSTLLVSSGADSPPAPAMHFIEQLRGLAFVSASQPQPLERPSLRFTIDKPAPAEQKRLWQQVLGAGATRFNGALDGIAGQFKLSARSIQVEGANLAPALAESDRPDRVMWSACRSIGRAKLDGLAQRLESSAGWDELLLPEAQKETLQQICAHVRNRLKVYVEWGFADRSARGLGISALFAGESGTGKTMAAEVLAHELQLDLYRIDLSAVVSKYIGETEKNLRRVFDAAEDSGAILLFDEADALFGKRSEVKDSHDRYANIEVSYLLQRMESYRGLAILTTNLKAALDVAFQRRLRFVVHFPFPDQAMREAIWRSAFPPRTRLGAIDTGKLARLNVTGGSIRNIAINAAFRAADLGEPVSMAHLLHAAHFEASKRGSPPSAAETRGWVPI
ncbi:ATP-binding protein [Azotobacter chroococcum]|uniref:ATP-binding protein n=1 Tax=Azotobacter chroococcum TaxID=353 RepID=UPI00103B4F22|nr:ATP-binding protein [Azotobacter chroococcum]TBW39882.1 ATP-binding protein [Azotobacter chroococcum]